MKIIVYPPATEEAAKELSKKAADIHSQAVLQYIQSLTCQVCQKQCLIAALLSDPKAK